MLFYLQTWLVLFESVLYRVQTNSQIAIFPHFGLFCFSCVAVVLLVICSFCVKSEFTWWKIKRSKENLANLPFG